MSYSQTQYLDLIDAVRNYYGSSSDQFVEFSKYGLKADNAIEILKQVPEVDVLQNADGSIRSIAYKNFSTKGNRATYLAESINSNVAGGSASVNKSTNISIPSNTKLNETTKTLEMSSEVGKKVSTGSKVLGVIGNIGQAILAVGTACTLGKTIDKALYNLSPDFWNAHDMETLDPDTWSSITNSGSLGDNIFNVLMGVDPDTNETTAYIDQNALAYMSLYLQRKGFFEQEQTIAEVKNTDIPENFTELKNSIESSITANLTTYAEGNYTNSSGDTIHYGFKTDTDTLMYSITTHDYPIVRFQSIKETAFNSGYTSSVNKPIDITTITTSSKANNITYNNKSWKQSNLNTGNKANSITIPSIKTKNDSGVALLQLQYVLLFNSTLYHTGGIDGVGTQDDATVPDLSGASSLEDVLNVLKTTLPNLFNNAITNSVPQSDGTIKEYTYIPFTLPNTSNNNDTQPTTDNQTQKTTQVDPNTSNDTLLDLVSKLLGNKLDTPNTPDTGSGDTPSSVIPTGSASALYKIYNPSQAQLDSFGAWLWSSNFVDQLLKVFNNPMESIIGLHKIYASPVIGGTSNIKVGYLDSGVSSNYVSNQYTKIDCGTVNLQEYFGNVFDYSPYTTIELYLPCIGFVQLDVANVMRSSINITYTVDVLTGACLAEVTVRRDNAGGVLYSYSGNCASQYPLSSGSYMGIVSSVIGVAGSIVGTVASGGSLAPLALGATSSLLNAKTHVQHSGSLSGNSGVMGGKIPYIIITRPQTNMAENYEHFQGIPSNVYTQLSACNGYVKVKNVNVQNINAESEELNEIKSLLMDGVLI